MEKIDSDKSSCFLILTAAFFALASLCALLLVLVNLPDHKEQQKMKKMLKHELTSAHKQIASRMVALPVAQERNIVYRSGKSKKYEENLYYALKSDDMDFDIEQNNDEYKSQKRCGTRDKEKASYIEMQSFKK